MQVRWWWLLVQSAVMDEAQILAAWQSDGFVVLTEFLSAGDLGPAVAQLGMMFPSADGFHDRSDPRYSRYLNDEFNGIDSFPFASTEVSLLAVHDRVVSLAYQFVSKATPRQLRLFGFPPPGHQFWTAETASAMQLRYPGTDWTAWLTSSPASSLQQPRTASQ
jgi:hypothetical protein